MFDEFDSEVRWLSDEPSAEREAPANTAEPAAAGPARPEWPESDAAREALFDCYNG